jgi:tRNA U54 and U55 pseudouridine synthase Pus10
MNEDRLLKEVFGGKKWKDKYFVEWCDLCDTAIIICLDPNCGGSSCNGHSCEKCHDDITEFDLCKTKVQDYLSKDEIRIYEKSLRIKKHILETLAKGEKEINWKKLQSNGELSAWEEQLFKEELTKGKQNE